MREFQATTVSNGDPCVCGQPVPWHLFKGALVTEHVCMCERLWEYNPKLDVATSTRSENNPLRQAFEKARKTIAIVQPPNKLKPRSPGATTLSAEPDAIVHSPGGVIEVHAPDGAREGQLVALDLEDPAVQGGLAAEEEGEEAFDPEKDYLEFFHHNADFGPAHEDVVLAIQQSYTRKTGRAVPKGWSYADDED